MGRILSYKQTQDIGRIIRKKTKKSKQEVWVKGVTVLDRCTIQHDTLITWLQTCNGNKKKENSCFIGKPTEATLVRNFSAALSAPRREINNNKEGVEKQGWDNALRRPRYFNPHPTVNGFFFSSTFESFSKAIVYVISQAQWHRR